MARRKNPWVTLFMFVALIGVGFTAYHFIYVKRIFETESVVAPPAAEMEKLRLAVDEALGTDECFANVTSFNWRESSKRYRVDVNMVESCGLPQAKRLASRISEVIQRASSGKFEAEVSVLILGREVHHFVP